jgi:hypothetical protein
MVGGDGGGCGERALEVRLVLGLRDHRRTFADGSTQAT